MMNIDTADRYISKKIYFSSDSNGGSSKNSKSTSTKQDNGNKRKGFASMTKERRLQIAKNGGNARKKAAEAGLAPSYSQIGQKGGKAGTKASK